VLELKIEKLNLGGQGIGYRGGKVCFVDYCIPNEKIRAEVIVEKKDYLVARCIEILEPSPYRIEPKCPIFKICGGCHLQHIDYKYQLQLKKEILLDSFRRIGKFEYDNIEVISDHPWHYRNRAQLPIQKNRELKIGYFKRGTHEVVNHKICYINQPAINKVVNVIRDYIKKSKILIYDEFQHKGNLRHLIVRCGTHTGQIFITFVTKSDLIPEILYKGLIEEIPEIVGITQNINPQRTNRILGRKNIHLSGRDYYEEIIDKKIFRIGPASFFQVNSPVFEKIIEKIKEEGEGHRVLDLYAGIGIIGICLSSQFKKVIVVEENSNAVNDGIENARLSGIKNIDFVVGRAEDNLNLIKGCDMIILDPPRKGVKKEIIEEIVRMKIGKIIYLSCNPASLARDMSLFIKGNYKIEKVFLFDMFAQTYHIEAMVLINLKN